MQTEAMEHSGCRGKWVSVPTVRWCPPRCPLKKSGIEYVLPACTWRSQQKYYSAFDVPVRPAA